MVGPYRALPKINDAAVQLSHYCRSSIVQHLRLAAGWTSIPWPLLFPGKNRGFRTGEK